MDDTFSSCDSLGVLGIDVEEEKVPPKVSGTPRMSIVVKPTPHGPKRKRTIGAHPDGCLVIPYHSRESCCVIQFVPSSEFEKHVIDKLEICRLTFKSAQTLDATANLRFADGRFEVSLTEHPEIWKFMKATHSIVEHTKLGGEGPEQPLRRHRVRITWRSLGTNNPVKMHDELTFFMVRFGSKERRKYAKRSGTTACDQPSLAATPTLAPSPITVPCSSPLRLNPYAISPRFLEIVFPSPPAGLNGLCDIHLPTGQRITKGFLQTRGGYTCLVFVANQQESASLLLLATSMMTADCAPIFMPCTVIADYDLFQSWNYLLNIEPRAPEKTGPDDRFDYVHR